MKADRMKFMNVMSESVLIGSQRSKNQDNH